MKKKIVLALCFSISIFSPVQSHSIDLNQEVESAKIIDCANMNYQERDKLSSFGGFSRNQSCTNFKRSQFGITKEKLFSAETNLLKDPIVVDGVAYSYRDYLLSVLELSYGVHENILYSKTDEFIYSIWNPIGKFIEAARRGEKKTMVAVFEKVKDYADKHPDYQIEGIVDFFQDFANACEQQLLKRQAEQNNKKEHKPQKKEVKL